VPSRALEPLLYGNIQRCGLLNSHEGFVAEAAARDALRCCIFLFSELRLRARYMNVRRIASRFTSALSLNCYARATVQGAFGKAHMRSQRCFLGGGQTEGRAQAHPPLKDHRLNGMLKKKVVVFTLLRERQSCERLSARPHTF
jgi:hypothetical protein